jgi:Flp pilus assembly protein TadD
MAYLHLVLGESLLAEDKTKDAVAPLQQAVLFSPTYAHAHRRLAQSLISLGNSDLAASHLQAAAAICPSDAGLKHCLGTALANLKRFDEALAQFHEAGRLDADEPNLDSDIAVCLLRAGRRSEVVRHCRESLERRPGDRSVANNLAWVLATDKDARNRNGAEAARVAEATCSAAGGDDGELLDTLAAAYAEQGRFEDAAKTAARALGLLRDARSPLAEGAEQRLKLYQAGLPFRDG